MGTGKDKVPLQELPAKTPPRAAPPTGNTVRRERAKRADDARTQGPTQPTPIQLYDHGTLTSTRRVCVPTGLLSPIWVCVDITEEEDIVVPRPPIVFELFGNPELKPDPFTRDEIWPLANVARKIPVRFGKFAAGEILVYKDDKGQLHTDKNGPQLLPFFHDAFPRIHAREEPVLMIDIDANVVTGELVMTPMGSPLGYITPIKRITGDNVAQILGLEDLQELTAWVGVNELKDGRFTFYMMPESFLLDGVFPQSDTNASLLHVVNGDTTFELWTDVAAKGVDKTPVQIKRDPLGGLLGKTQKLRGKLVPKKGHVIEGDLEATFGRGRFDIRGHLKYTSTKPKITGEIFVQVTDYATAREAAAQRLGDLAPPEYALDEVPNGLAMWGMGSLDFAFNEWFTGRAEVIVDPDGFITTRGHLSPTKVFTLYEQAKSERPMFADEHSVHFVVPPGIPASAKAKLKVTFFSEVGPVVLGDIVVEGVYSTRPGITRRLSLAGTLGGKIKVGYRATLTGSVSIAMLAHAGLRFKGEAALEGKLALRPRIGWIGRGKTDVDDDPASGKYYVQGRAQVEGAVVLGARLDVFGQLGLPEFEIPDVVPFFGGRTVKPSVEISMNVFSTSWRWAALKSAWDFNHEVGKKGTGPKSLTRDDGGIEKNDLLDRMVGNELESGTVSDEPVGSYKDFVRDEEMLTTETPPEPSLAETETTTPTIAGGNVEGDEFEALPEGPAPTPPAPPTTTPSIPTPSTPPPPAPGAPPPDASADVDAGPPTTVPDPGTTPPSPQPTPPPPTPAPTPPADDKQLFAPPKSDDLGDLVVPFKMSGQPHTLFLNRTTEPGMIRMASRDAELLWKQLRGALIAVKSQKKDAERDGTVDARSVDELAEEEDTLTSLYNEVLTVQKTAQELGPNLGESEVGGVAKPIPRHVPGYPPLADRLEGYAEEFDRSDLPAVTRTTKPSPARDPRLAGLSTPRLDQLAEIDPGRAKRYIDEYALYEANCALPEVRTPQPMDVYLDRRAARKLGNMIEIPAIKRYNLVTGRNVAKNSREVELVNRRTKRVKKLAADTDRREPDFFVPGTVLGDIKHVKKQDRTPQMLDFATICESQDVDGEWDARFQGETTLFPPTPIFDLVVRDATHRHPATIVSGPLRDLIRDHGGMVRHLIDDEVEGRDDQDSEP